MQKQLQKEKSIHHTKEIQEKILLHPSQVGDVQKWIKFELRKKINKWNDNFEGIVQHIDKIKLLNGGQGRILDDSPYVHYVVRYVAKYIKPEIGGTYKAKIQDIQFGYITLLLEKRFTVHVKIEDLDKERYQITNKEQSLLNSDQGSQANQEDFDDINEILTKLSVKDTKLNKELKENDRVKVEITSMQVSQGNVILNAQLK